MDRAILLEKIFWNLQENWYLRPHKGDRALCPQETAKGLQRILLAEEGAMLASTLQHAFAHPVALHTLRRLDIVLYQEGMEQRVWRAVATLEDGTARPFGIIAARTPGPCSTLTQRDFHHLQTLHAQQPRYCVEPYTCGTMPIAGGVAVYTVEWLDDYKELVFEVARRGGVFLVNAHGAHQAFSLQESRQIWRRLVEILWWYPHVRGVNIQAGDFVGRLGPDGRIELKLTTARQLAADPHPAEHLRALLGSVITASGYLSDGQQPFARQMPRDVFLHRMRAVLQRRFGAQADAVARQQWDLFRTGVFARQEDWLKEDCVLATYDRMLADLPAARAWQETCQHWRTYAEAVQSAQLPPSWWFPAGEVSDVLDRLAPEVTRQQQYG